MNLLIKQYPKKRDYYYVTSSNYYVVGGAKHLVHKDNLAKIWAYSLFSLKEAQSFIKRTQERDAVRLEDIKTLYGYR